MRYRSGRMADLLSLEGRVAFVTGAGRGIGAAVVRAFVEKGARVAALDRDGGAVAAVCAPFGDRTLALAGDVSRRAEVEAAVAEAVARWARIDVLVNNAGLVRDATLRKATDEDWALTLDVNLKGAFLCGRAIAPGMAERGYGRIVSASSIVARTGNFGQSAYSASKGGIVGLTRTWARELGGRGVTANVVAPGFVDTDMLRSIPPAVLAEVNARIPAGRLGRPEEVASVYLFLASEPAGFVNGAVVGADGGLRL
jgi:3-oxoacyl-[acyl-carrier protein] reductase